MNILIEFLETGAVQPKKEQINLDGQIGTLMMQYIAYKKDQRLHENTISIHECHLSRFLHFLRADSKLKRVAIEQAYVDVAPKEEPFWEKNENLLSWLKSL